LYTVEFFPEEGKYHYDGHRLCNLSLSPEQSKKYNNICPRCGKPLVIGVLNRVAELADRPEGFVPENAIPFKSLIPLNEIVAESIGTSVVSKEAVKHYNNLIKNLGNEFKILLESSRKEIEKESLPEIAEGVMRMREGKIFIEPGYDGVYGKIKIFPDEENKKESYPQKTLF
jgi:PHP family Zn ribbon phosphoesterase